MLSQWITPHRYDILPLYENVRKEETRMAQISVNGLTFCYDGSYADVFSGVSFSLDTSWRLGLVGRNGRGKTTLLRILTGELEYRGSVSSPVLFSYFPAEPEDPSASCAEVAEQASGGAPEWKI